MSQSTILTDRDRLIIDCLGNRVRLLTPSQLSRAFFGGDDRYTQRRARRLINAGLIASKEVVARISPPLDAPLLSWEPGQTAPDFSAFSFALLARWKKQASKATRVFSLGATASKLLGFSHGHGVKSALQIGHDLALSEVFIRYLRSAPELAHCWIKEDCLSAFGVAYPKRGKALPDAMVVDEHFQPVKAIELGGLYSPERLKKLHESFSDRRLSYELW